MKGELVQVNKQSGRIGLYLVLIVALIAGYLYLNNQVADSERLYSGTA